MNIRRLIILILTILGCANLSCDRQKTPIMVTQYTDPSGITGIAKHNGYIWCATKGGLLRWDIAAREYELITTAEGLISNVLNDIVVDRDSTLWVSSREGLASLDGKIWKHFDLAQGLPSTYINDLELDRNGELWVATNDGVARFKNGKFSLLAETGSPGRKPITSVFFDAGNNIWISVENEGIYCKIEGEWTIYQKNYGKMAQSWDLNIWVYNEQQVKFWNGLSFSEYLTAVEMKTVGARYIQAFDDRLWYFTQNGVHSSRGNSDWVHFTQEEGLASNDILSGLVVSNDEIYVGTANGLSIINNGIVNNYIIPNTPVGYNPISVTMDPHKRVWLGTWETGVNLLENDVWTLLTADVKSNPALSTVRSFVFGPGGERVFNTVNGVLFNEQNTWRQEKRVDGLSGDDVRCGLYDREGRYWAGTNSGICYLENGQWTRYRAYQGLPSEDTWACTMDSTGTVWFGTTAGIVSFTNGKMQNRTTETGLDSLDVRAVYANGNSVWFGASDGRLAVFDGSSWNVYGNQKIGTSRAIYAIAGEPDGAVWLGTDGDGIIRFQRGKTEQYTTRDGIPFNVVRSLSYADGKLWLACYGGAAVLQHGSK